MSSYPTPGVENARKPKILVELDVEFRYLKEDARHFLVNLGETSAGFLFYLKFGFYGWPHLLSVLFIQYSVIPFDDWLEKKRPFPYHAIALIGFYYYLYFVV